MLIRTHLFLMTDKYGKRRVYIMFGLTIIKDTLKEDEGNNF